MDQTPNYRASGNEACEPCRSMGARYRCMMSWEPEILPGGRPQQQALSNGQGGSGGWRAFEVRKTGLSGLVRGNDRLAPGGSTSCCPVRPRVFRVGRAPVPDLLICHDCRRPLRSNAWLRGRKYPGTPGYFLFFVDICSTFAASKVLVVDSDSLQIYMRAYIEHRTLIFVPAGFQEPGTDVGKLL